jgi:hypothetical protein
MPDRQSRQPAAKSPVHHASVSAGGIVTAMTSTSETAHYDCGKAGTANKKDCK